MKEGSASHPPAAAAAAGNPSFLYLIDFGICHGGFVSHCKKAGAVHPQSIFLAIHQDLGGSMSSCNMIQAVSFVKESPFLARWDEQGHIVKQVLQLYLAELHTSEDIRD